MAYMFLLSKEGIYKATFWVRHDFLYLDKVLSQNSVFFPCLYRASVTTKILYYPTDAQIYNS